jgi:4-hydroxythreonine-4-phosphate dehydrogenase
MGDPSGVGPELLLKLASCHSNDSIEIQIYGSRLVLDETAKHLGLPLFTGTVVNVLKDAPFEFGKPNKFCARIQYNALVRAVEDALDGHVDGVVTAPWTKKILTLAGLPSSGHTEVLEHLCSGLSATMMLCGDVLKVALATTHIPISEVSGSLTGEKVFHHLMNVNQDLKCRFNILNPAIAVCGLNPHAGEEGIMGDEEGTLLLPAIKKAQNAGINAQGPYSADALFARVVRQRHFDVVLAMYHDQGLIPLKMWHSGRSANVTLGLPIIRTSVDHGTAHDIAGKGVGDPGSLIYALELAHKMVENERSKKE